MIPPQHMSLLIANDTRAQAWEKGLRGAGMDARCIQTSGSDAAKGEYWLVIPVHQKVMGQRYVSAVLGGTRQLPKVTAVRGVLWWGALLIVLGIAILLGIGILDA